MINFIRDYEFGLWKQGCAIGILGIHVSNSCNSVYHLQFYNYGHIARFEDTILY